MQTAKIIQQNEPQMVANGEFWEQFNRDFQLHASHLDDLSEWTSSAMFTLHLQLLFNNEYQHALNRAANGAVTNNNLVIPLFDADFLRVNLIAILPERNLPLHDHPGSAGSMLVISGHVRAVVCEEAGPTGTTQQSNLTIVANKVFSTGETACFTQDQHNIHGIEALTERAVLMVIHTPPFTSDQQSFFFTATPEQKIGSQVRAQRVPARTSQNFRLNKHHKIMGILK